MLDADDPLPMKPLQKNHYLIIQLAIVDEHGKIIQKPLMLQDGGNVLKCKAMYVDGSWSFYEPYWTCPMRLKSGDSDPWCVFGKRRKSSVTVHASARHERYSEIACWTFDPEANRAGEIVHDSTSFDYSLIRSC